MTPDRLRPTPKTSRPSFRGNRFLASAAGLLLCLVLLQTLWGSTSRAEGKEFKVGVVPQFEVRRVLEIWTPILAEISKTTGLKFRLNPSSSIPEFESEFEAGLFDFAYMNPYHLLVANQVQGYIPIARDVGRTLYGIIVVRKDSQIKDVKELQGKKIAFPAPNALGAALIPRAEFATVYGIDYQALYVRSHTSVYLNVLLKQAEAGGGVRATFDEQKPEVKSGLRILHETVHTAPHPFAAHPRVPEQVRKKVAEALLAMGRTPEGRARLDEVPIKKIGPADLEDYESLRDLGLEKFYVRP